MRTTNYEDALIKRLKNKKYAVGLLHHAFEESCNDGNWKAFGLILAQIIEAQGTKQEFARKAKVSRQHLYRLFGKNCNPTLATLLPVLAELDCKLTITSAESLKKKTGER
jgi:DNA-binding phage protein